MDTTLGTASVAALVLGFRIYFTSHSNTEISQCTEMSTSSGSQLSAPESPRKRSKYFMWATISARLQVKSALWPTRSSCTCITMLSRLSDLSPVLRAAPTTDPRRRVPVVCTVAAADGGDEDDVEVADSLTPARCVVVFSVRFVIASVALACCPSSCPRQASPSSRGVLPGVLPSTLDHPRADAMKPLRRSAASARALAAASRWPVCCSAPLPTVACALPSMLLECCWRDVGRSPAEEGRRLTAVRVADTPPAEKGRTNGPPCGGRPSAAAPALGPLRLCTSEAVDPLRLCDRNIPRCLGRTGTCGGAKLVRSRRRSTIGHLNVLRWAATLLAAVPSSASSASSASSSSSSSSSTIHSVHSTRPKIVPKFVKPGSIHDSNTP